MRKCWRGFMLMLDVNSVSSLYDSIEKLSKDNISVMVVDDHPVVRFGVVSLLRMQSGIEVIGEAGSCAALGLMLEKKRPQVLLLDLDLGDVCGPEVLEKVRAKYPDQKVIIYSSYDNEACVTDTLRIGIQGYVLKGSSIEKLCEAIHAVAQGRFYMDPALAIRVMGHMRPQMEQAMRNWTTLTPREKSVIRLVAAGKRNKEIADKLYISERTVKYHISSLFKKLQATNRTELSRIAVSEGLISH